MDDPRRIFNWLEVDARLTSSGQPSAADIAGLHALGVTVIVNLGPHDHEKALPGEAGIVEGLGMRYVHIPVDFAEPREADYARFSEVMAQTRGERVHIHCIANARVTAFLYRYRREAGTPEPELRAMLDRVWRPGGVWARFIGDDTAVELPHRYVRRDYQLP